MVPDPADAVARLRRSPVLRAWLLSRAVVLAALAAAALFHANTRGGLLSWDGVWYDDIATHGYLDSPDGAVRFFPVWPLLARAVAWLTHLPPGLVLVLLANAIALPYLAWARRVALAEGLGTAVADRVPYVVALAPAGAVLVMGYTEALFGLLLCVLLLSARSGRWMACAGAGLVLGALRPTGVTLALVVAIEAARTVRGAGGLGVLARAVAVAAPVAGLASYLGWAATTYGDALAPFRTQLDPSLRGGVFVNPLHTLAQIPQLLTHQAIVGLTLNLVTIVLALVLLVVCARRLPLSYTVFAAVTVFLGVTAREFSSFERYACSALPLLLAAATVLSERPRLRRWTSRAAPVVLFAQAVLTFKGVYLP